jgi:hypothetical protein
MFCNKFRSLIIFRIDNVWRNAKMIQDLDEMVQMEYKGKNSSESRWLETEGDTIAYGATMETNNPWRLFNYLQKLLK